MSILKFDPAVYSFKAVKCAAFDCGSKASVDVESDIDGKIVVHISATKQHNRELAHLETEFRRCVLDHQIRIEIGEEFKLIRDMIIAQAFAPCDNLEEIIDKATNAKTE
jgi:His-Xaa-Ser system protein HxsD